MAWKIRGIYIALIAIAVVFAMVLSALSAMAGTTVSFSPERVWNKDFGESYGVLSSVTPQMDANGDGFADIQVEFNNYSSANPTHTVVLLDGKTGAVLHERTFNDTGYYKTGDNVFVNATVFGIMLENTNGNPVKDKEYMVFSNHSNNKIVSIYSLDYPTLQIDKYRKIVIPDEIKALGQTVTVNRYQYSISMFSSGYSAYMLYTGYYMGNTILGVPAVELQTLVLDENLTTVWEKNETGYEYTGYFSLGVDMVDFNGLGVNGTYPTLLYANVSSNTVLEAIDSITGKEIWNLTVPGMFPIINPLSFKPLLVPMDYNIDNKTDFAMPTLDTNNKKEQVNFISSSGSLLGYYSTGLGNITLPALYTDIAVGKFHKLIQTIDANGDGAGDFLILDNNTNLLCWDIAHNTTVWTKNLVNQSYEYLPYISTGDINGDGTWDIFITGTNKTSNGEGSNVNLTALSGKDGETIYTRYYAALVAGYSGTMFKKEITDFDGDGIQDSGIASGYYYDGNLLHVNISAVSMKTGVVLWSSNISAGLGNSDFNNWYTTILPSSDINGDGINDMLVSIVYKESNGTYNTFMRVLSGTNGTVLWSGEVLYSGSMSKFEALSTITAESGWAQFDYNGDGIENELLIQSGYSVSVYAVTEQSVPEFGTFLPALVLIAAVIIVAKKRRVR